MFSIGVVVIESQVGKPCDLEAEAINERPSKVGVLKGSRHEEY